LTNRACSEPDSLTDQRDLKRPWKLAASFRAVSSFVIRPPVTGKLIWLEQQNFVACGSLFLALLYTVEYLGYPTLPGNDVRYPLGWWGWFDQSKYLQSAQALARFDFSPAHHWYPLGYALLGAPFVGMMPQHPFFFVDLAALLITYTAFNRFALRCDVALHWSVILFALACAADPVLFHEWVIPWNTSPLAAVMWLLLATAAAHIQGERHPAWLGALAAVVPMLRPTDVLIAAVPVLASLAADLARHRLRARDVAVFIAGALLPLAAYGALHLAIYGPRPSEYMRHSGEIGFSLHDLGLKAYLILVDPRAWIGGGEGLIRRCPWLILGIAGLLTALRRPIPAMLAAALVVHGIIYMSYVDLLPTSFWRYGNVHYWTFTFPGFALLGFLLLRDLTVLRYRAVAAGSLISVMFLLCVKLDPVTAAPDQRADAVDVPVGPNDFNTIYFGNLRVTDAKGTLENVKQVRAFPVANGIRILALTRSLDGPVTVEGEGMHVVTPVRLRAVVHWGIPFWLWSRAGEFYGPRL
jgi:hypothetical protein